MSVLGKEPVTRMDRVNVSDFRRTDQSVDAQIAFATGGRSDADRLVGHLDMHRVGVHLGIDGHGPDAEFAAGSDDADGDFATVGDEDFLKHRVVGENKDTALARCRAGPACPGTT